MELEQQPLPPSSDASVQPVGFTHAEITTLEPRPRGVLIGRFGLRAGWGVLLYLVFVTVFVVILQIGALAATGKLKSTIAERRQAAVARQNGTTAPVKPAKPKGDGQMHPKGTVIGEALVFGGIVLASFIMAKIERRRFAVFGIGGRSFASVFPGAFWGLAAMSLLILILYAGHFLVFDGRILFGGMAVAYGLKWLIAFALVGLLEEYLFRGYLQYTLTRAFFGVAENLSATNARGVAFLFAAVITSVFFFFAHTGNDGENAFGLFSVFLAGVVFTFALWRTGSLWWAIGFHTTWDWAQSFLYGVPDSGNLSFGRLFQTHTAGSPLLSGGTAGPEGSVFLVPVLLLVLVVIYFTHPGTQPSLEADRPVADPRTEHPGATPMVA